MCACVQRGLLLALMLSNCLVNWHINTTITMYPCADGDENVDDGKRERTARRRRKMMKTSQQRHHTSLLIYACMRSSLLALVANIVAHTHTHTSIYVIMYVYIVYMHFDVTPFCSTCALSSSSHNHRCHLRLSILLTLISTY